ncbi:MAG: hypothetical protein VX733_15525 [Candidatus Latescibacterota bacterium]|nr:hypothetical protein [Candidatus Latescibacterota bacterium]
MKLISILIAGSPLLAGPVPASEGAEIIDYFGYRGCIALTNDDTRVVLTTHGGRILEYALHGENAIHLDPAQKGWVYEPGQPTVDPTGGRLDIGPEALVPRRPELWLGEWQAEITGSHSARLTSVKSEATGVQLVRDFVLADSGTHLGVTQTVNNISEDTTEWCHWSRTFGLGGGIVLIPLEGQSRFPERYVMYGPGPVMNYRPNDPNIRVRDGFLEILGPPQRAKLGMDSYAGWFSYLTKNDLMWVKRYPVYRDRVYNEMAGLTISIWYNKEQMTELEPIGPREVLGPGESSSFTEDWWLLSHPYPEMGSEVDLEAVVKVVNEHVH